jgi:hypothetical protein
MNSFIGWRKVVLAVVVLALLSRSVAFHRVLRRLVRLAVNSKLPYTERKLPLPAKLREGWGEGFVLVNIGLLTQV